MIRRTLRKIIPTYAIFPLILTGLMNLFAYQGNKLIQFIVGIDRGVDLTTPWDSFFAFHPTWVLVYIGTFVFWAYQYTTVARESPEKAYQLAAADFVAKLICFFFFAFMPTTNVRPEVEGSGFIPFLMRFIYWFDTPTNLFPSIHCFVAWLGTRYMFECKKLRHKGLTCTLCVIGSILVFLSTLHTKQHVLPDVAAGIVVAEIGWFTAQFTKLPKVVERINDKFMKTRLCKIL